MAQYNVGRVRGSYIHYIDSQTDVPLNALLDDLGIDTSTWDVYKFDGNAWIYIDNIHGVAAGFDTPSASATTLAAGSQATVSVSSSGPDTAKKFDFTFGIPGSPIVTATVDNSEADLVGQAHVEVTNTGTTYAPNFQFAFKQLQGVGVQTIAITYQQGDSATVVPTGTWSDTPVEADPGKYLWTRYIFNKTDGTNATAYSVARQGSPSDIVNVTAIEGLGTGWLTYLQQPFLTGNIPINGNLTVSGTITSEGEISAPSVDTTTVTTDTISSDNSSINISKRINANGISSTGDTQLVGDLTVSNNITVDSAITAQNITATNTLTVQGDTLLEDTTVNNLVIQGNVTQQGSSFITEAETVEVKDNMLVLNNGETGAGVTAGQAGIEIDRGTSNPFFFVFNEDSDRFEVGTEGGLQPVMLRDIEANLTDTNILVWDATNKRAVTSSVNVGNLTQLNLNTKGSYSDNGYIVTKAEGNTIIGRRITTDDINGCTNPWFRGNLKLQVDATIDWDRYYSIFNVDAPDQTIKFGGVGDRYTIDYAYVSSGTNIYNSNEILRVYPTNITFGNKSLAAWGSETAYDSAFLYKRGLTINGTTWNMVGTTSGNTATIFAPTTAGTSGYILQSNGSGAPSWVAKSVTIAQISNLNSGWNNLLAAAPSSFVTRWPQVSEVTGLQDALDAKADSGDLGDYLPLSGGTLTGNLNIRNTNNTIGFNTDHIEIKTYNAELNVVNSNSTTNLHINYRASALGGTVPTNWYWRNGSSTSWANGYWGNLYMSGNLVATQSWVLDQISGSGGGTIVSVEATGTAPLTLSASTLSGAVTISGSVAAASASASGVVSTGNQTFAGAKTFNGQITSSTIVPRSDSSYNIGTSSNRYANIYADTFYGNLSGNASSATSASTASTASKLGTVDVGSPTTPIYLDGGSPTASTATVGDVDKPVYLKDGTITALSKTVGSSTEPVYLNGGKIATCGPVLSVGITGNAAFATSATNADKVDNYHVVVTDTAPGSSADPNTIYFVTD